MYKLFLVTGYEEIKKYLRQHRNIRQTLNLSGGVNFQPTELFFEALETIPVSLVFLSEAVMARY